MRWFVIFLILMARPVMAADTALRAMVMADDARDWSAIGRLNVAGEGFCSATLISDRLVLTAAHCLFLPQDHHPPAPQDIEFLAGWRNGGAVAYRHARRYVIHPDFQHETDDWAARLQNDVALIELDIPIRDTVIQPLPMRQSAQYINDVFVISYAQDRDSAPSIQESCNILARSAGKLVLSCLADFGASGAPVLALIDGQAQVVGMLAAKAQRDDVPVSMAAELGPAIARLLPLLSAAGTGFARRSAQSGSIAEQLGRN